MHWETVADRTLTAINVQSLDYPMRTGFLIFVRILNYFYIHFLQFLYNHSFCILALLAFCRTIYC